MILVLAPLVNDRVITPRKKAFFSVAFLVDILVQIFPKILLSVWSQEVTRSLMSDDNDILYSTSFIDDKEYYY